VIAFDDDIRDCFFSAWRGSYPDQLASFYFMPFVCNIHSTSWDVLQLADLRDSVA